MLRSVGIPSRVVNGFRTTEFNDLTSSYVIRASSAHSWVEVYFPGTGWVEFDPTPPAPLLEREGWNRVSLYADAMASFWREWVVNYDIGHQRFLGQNAMGRDRFRTPKQLDDSGKRVSCRTRHRARNPGRDSGCESIRRQRSAIRRDR